MYQKLRKTLCSFLFSTKRSIKGLLWVKGLLEITLCSSSTYLPLSILSRWLDCKFAPGNFSCNSYPVVPVLNNTKNQLNPEANHTPTPESPDWWCDPLIMHFLICTWDTWKPHVALLLCFSFSIYVESHDFHIQYFTCQALLGLRGWCGGELERGRSCSLFQTQ